MLPSSRQGANMRPLNCSQAIKSLCREVGITRNDAEDPLHRLDNHIRADLDSTSERVLAVLKPLKLILTNLLGEYSSTVAAKVRSPQHMLTAG